VLEGNACGTPAIATDVPGLRDSVRHGETGILVPFAEVSALAEQTIALLQDESLRTRLSRNAVEWAARFTWDGAAQDIGHIIDAAVAGDSPTDIDLAFSPFTD